MSDGDLTEHLLDLELQLATRRPVPGQRSLSDMLADDFHEFGRSGKAWTKATILPELVATDNPDTVELRDFRVQRLSDTIALATYQSHRADENGVDILTNRSSIWRLDADQHWRVVFHQGTATE